MNENGLNYIDLFAGAGGLSEGFIQSGYRPVAHVEMNGYAAKTLETRIAYYYLKDNGELNSYYDYEKGKITRTQLLEKIPEEELKTVINKEMSESTIKGIFNTIDEIKKEKGIEKIDVIIGGPPCQAYSLVGRAQSSHMIVPMEDDPRNELYKMYVQFLNKYKPRMFVFENVAGIKSARGGQTTLFYHNGELCAWLKDTAFLEKKDVVKTTKLSNVWKNDDIPKADLGNEGGVAFPRSKKPEKLIERILLMATNEGDLVLDSFLGSGTTAAVAHKMRRRYIGIELGDHCYTHCKKRLDRVIDGKDRGGVTNTYDWQGGGGYKFYELAEPLLVKNKVLPVYQINPSYTWDERNVYAVGIFIICIT